MTPAVLPEDERQNRRVFFINAEARRIVNDLHAARWTIDLFLSDRDHESAKCGATAIRHTSGFGRVFVTRYAATHSEAILALTTSSDISSSILRVRTKSRSTA